MAKWRSQKEVFIKEYVEKSSMCPLTITHISFSPVQTTLNDQLAYNETLYIACITRGAKRLRATVGILLMTDVEYQSRRGHSFVPISSLNIVILHLRIHRKPQILARNLVCREFSKRNFSSWFYMRAVLPASSRLLPAWAQNTYNVHWLLHFKNVHKLGWYITCAK